MKILLLLAGRSRRFWPLAEKSLFPIAGKTLLEHQIGRLKKGGCKEADIILVGGAHNLADVRSFFPKLKTIEQKNLDLGMQGALLNALPSVGKEAVMIVGGNDVIDPAAYDMLRKAAAKKAGAILAYRVQRYFPGGYLTVAKNRVTGIVEKPGEGNAPSDLVNIVAHIHNDASLVLNALKNAKSSRDDAYEVALQSLFKVHDYAAVPYDGAWQPVKYPWHLLPLLQLFLSEAKKPAIHPSAKIHKTAVIDGPVVIGKNVKVLPHSTIVGPCVIGDDSIIGNNALVRQSSIGRHCVIGYNTEVKGSVLADHVWTHSTYLGDSVVGDNVSFGGGCVTGNFRLDEGEIMSKVGEEMIGTGLTKLGAIIGSGCRIGIQIGTNPGVKIGKDSFFVGSTLLMEDVPEKSFVRMKDGKVTVSPNRTTAPSAEEKRKYIQ